MAHGRQRDPRLEAYWRKKLRRQRKSGLSVREFCAREGVPESACRAWHRIIQQRDLERRGPEHAESSPPPAFLPVLVANSNDQDASGGVMPITIELRGGRVMRLPAAMPSAQLAAVLRAVEEGA